MCNGHSLTSSVYGLTECLAAIQPHPNPKSGYIGVLAPDVEARLVDNNTMQDVGPNITGELYLKSPSVCALHCPVSGICLCSCS